MGYTAKKSLAGIVDDSIEAVPPTCRSMADAVGGRMTDITIQNTGVDSGALRNDIRQKPMRIYSMASGRIVYETGSWAFLDYAKWVEEGTGKFGPSHMPYLIEPKIPGGMLSWVDRDTGVRVFAKKVLHPGSPGQHMFAIGVAKAESEFDRLVQPALRDFARRATGTGVQPTFTQPAVFIP